VDAEFPACRVAADNGLVDFGKEGVAKKLVAKAGTEKSYVRVRDI
jgi:hypothetical protein